MDDEAFVRAAHHAERNEIAFVIWDATAEGEPTRQPRALFDKLNQPPGEHPALRRAFFAADQLLRSVAVVKALFDVRLTARLKLGQRTTGARIGVSDYSTADLIVALKGWGDEMDRSASELMMAGEISAGGGSAKVAALMKEAAARLQSGVPHAG